MLCFEMVMAGGKVGLVEVGKGEEKGDICDSEVKKTEFASMHDFICNLIFYF